MRTVHKTERQAAAANQHKVLHASPAMLHHISHQLRILEAQPGACPRNLEHSKARDRACSSIRQLTLVTILAAALVLLLHACLTHACARGKALLCHVLSFGEAAGQALLYRCTAVLLYCNTACLKHGCTKARFTAIWLCCCTAPTPSHGLHTHHPTLKTPDLQCLGSQQRCGAHCLTCVRSAWQLVMSRCVYVRDVKTYIEPEYCAALPHHSSTTTTFINKIHRTRVLRCACPTSASSLGEVCGSHCCAAPAAAAKKAVALQPSLPHADMAVTMSCSNSSSAMWKAMAR
jgi:hypothetical protein